MIGSHKIITEEQKEIINQWLKSDVRMISKGDILIFKADIVNSGLDMTFVNDVQEALSNIFPNQNIVVLPIDMEIEIFKEI